MNINATLFAQIVVFAILVLFTMKFVWPPIAKALDERALKITEGLASAEKAKSELAGDNILPMSGRVSVDTLDPRKPDADDTDDSAPAGAHARQMTGGAS